MNPLAVFWIVLVGLVIAVLYLDWKHNMLRDTSSATRKPYSYALSQLAWWTVIILASFISVMASKGIPPVDPSTLILLGISAATTAAARIGDMSDTSQGLTRTQDQASEGFFIDILSDSNGVNIHRFQALAFNLTFGIWFIHQVLHFLPITDQPGGIIPVLDQSNLLLLGLSSTTYAVLKTSENKSTPKQAQP
ncbi:MAG TPA: hypothetical protein VK569_06390 [Bacteroidota bacterium]|nr:hypothetical protein [Bacteroidota bacterium]